MATKATPAKVQSVRVEMRLNRPERMDMPTHVVGIGDDLAVLEVEDTSTDPLDERQMIQQFSKDDKSAMRPSDNLGLLQFGLVQPKI